MHNNRAPNLKEKKRPMSDRGASGFKAPKPSSQILNRNDARKRVRMLHDTYEDDDTNHDYLKDDVDIDDLVIPLSNVNNFAGDNNNDGGKGDTKPLQVQIAELEVKILTAKRALLQTQSARLAQLFRSAIAKRDAILRSHASE